MKKDEKIAIVYDWVDKMGGVERLLLCLFSQFPQADLYTSYKDDKKALWARNIKTTTSFIHKLPSFIKKSRIASILFYPLAFETFDFSKYTYVISVSSSFAKGIITKPTTKHISILLTPTRYFWGQKYSYKKTKNPLSTILISYLRVWDYIAAQRADVTISISQTVQERVNKYYKRDSVIMYPPFDISYWKNIEKKNIDVPFKGKYYLIVSRLEPYKNVDVAIHAFNTMPEENLVIIGKGSEYKYLRSFAKPNTYFMSDLTDQQLAGIYSKAEALIMPQEEDFGYVSLEAQICGCPVIALNKGGAKETITEHTGILFENPTVHDMCKAVEKYKTLSYTIRGSLAKNIHLDKFSQEVFIKNIQNIIT
jgi:glycosyltransferase involved in cell wall biosynthesis